MSTKAKHAAPAPNAPAPAPRFVIEDNIPLPERRIGGTRESAYPFSALAVGQSFFVPASETMKEPWKTLTSVASREGRSQFPKQFTTARVTVNGVEGVRVWRKEDATGDQKPIRKIKRKPKDEAAALAREAQEGDTSGIKHHAPDFDTPPPPVS